MFRKRSANNIPRSIQKMLTLSVDTEFEDTGIAFEELGLSYLIRDLLKLGNPQSFSFARRFYFGHRCFHILRAMSRFCVSRYYTLSFFDCEGGTLATECWHNVLGDNSPLL